MMPGCSLCRWKWRISLRLQAWGRFALILGVASSHCWRPYCDCDVWNSNEAHTVTDMWNSNEDHTVTVTCGTAMKTLLWHVEQQWRPYCDCDVWNSNDDPSVISVWNSNDDPTVTVTCGTAMTILLWLWRSNLVNLLYWLFYFFIFIY